MSNLCANFQIHFISRSFAHLLRLCRTGPTIQPTVPITGNVLAAAAAEDQTTLQFHANLDMLTNGVGGGGASGANHAQRTKDAGGADSSQASPLKDILAKVRRSRKLFLRINFINEFSLSNHQTCPLNLLVAHHHLHSTSNPATFESLLLLVENCAEISSCTLHPDHIHSFNSDPEFAAIRTAEGRKRSSNFGY